MCQFIFELQLICNRLESLQVDLAVTTSCSFMVLAACHYFNLSFHQDTMHLLKNDMKNSYQIDIIHGEVSTESENA